MMYLFIAILSVLTISFTSVLKNAKENSHRQERDVAISSKQNLIFAAIAFVLLSGIHWLSQYLLLTTETFLSLLPRMMFLSFFALMIASALNAKRHLNRPNSFPLTGSVTGLGGLTALLLIAFVATALYGSLSASKKYEQVSISEPVSEIQAFDENALPISVPMSFAKNKFSKAFVQVPNSSYYELGTPQIQLLNGEVVYVAPVEFTGYTRWNKKKTSPGYLVLSATDKSAKAKFVESEIEWMPSAFFSKDAERTIHQAFPKLVRFGGIQFEVDEKGKSYFFQAYGDYMVGRSGFIPKGILLLDGATGEVKRISLKDIPSWLDAPISSQSVALHNEIFGSYKHGLWNSIVTHQDVILPTFNGNEDGVTPVFFDNEMFYFTDFESPKEGIDSMMGYTLTNSRTGEITFYTGTNSSFMDSTGAGNVADKIFAEKKWHSAVPILYNFYGETSWYVPMVDKNGFLHQTIIVSASNPEVYAASSNTKDALKRYKAALSGNMSQSISGDSTADKTTETITISRSYKEKVESGTAVYLLDKQGRMFVVSSELDPKSLFLQENDQVTIEFNPIEGVSPVLSIEFPY